MTDAPAAPAVIPADTVTVASASAVAAADTVATAGAVAPADTSATPLLEIRSSAGTCGIVSLGAVAVEAAGSGGDSAASASRNLALGAAQARLAELDARLAPLQTEIDQLSRQFWVSKPQVRANKYDLSASRYRQVEAEAAYRPAAGVVIQRLMELNEVMDAELFALQEMLGGEGAEEAGDGIPC